jgi:tetrahydromethanopterin S-methyltransferase subunit G
MTDAETRLDDLERKIDNVNRWGRSEGVPLPITAPIIEEGHPAYAKMKADERARQARLAQAKRDDEARQREYAKRAPQRARAAAEAERVRSRLGAVEAERTELLARLHQLEREAS